jgi:glutathione S-transferase
MLKIHGFGPSRSLRVVWLAEEMGVKYQFVNHPMPVGDAYKKINPLGTLPFVEDDGSVGITESVAAMLYVAEQYGPTPLLPHKGDPDLGRVLQMTVFGEATLGMWASPVFGTRFAGPDNEHNNWTVNMAVGKLNTALRYLSDQIGSGPYIAGSKFTVADVSVGYGVGICGYLFKDDMPANVKDYHKRVSERPAYQRASAVK